MAKALSSSNALSGDDVRVNAFTIEKRLADIWREEQEKEEEKAVTRAALWNVVAHTWHSDHHAFAAQILGRASASVPQRTIVVRADLNVAPELSSWISANCHLIGGGRQVCSEEVAIVAGGDRVHHIPPLVASLLLPDMPVAVWWLGDLPSEHHGYVESLLDPADRLIVDSSYFNGAHDFELVSKIAEKTTTVPADLNWVRIEEWRTATAALFDPPSMRVRLEAVSRVRVTAGEDASLGAAAEGVLYVAWLIAQLGYQMQFELARGDQPGINAVELHFHDDSVAHVRVERERGVIVASSQEARSTVDCVTRRLAQDLEELIVRLLKRPEADRVYVRALRVARDIAARVAA
jgi:glucose-6-phosphate dehydrogenase assembly protein OpcA